MQQAVKTDDDPHGVQKLLALLRTQQQGAELANSKAASASTTTTTTTTTQPVTSSSRNGGQALSPAPKEDFRFVSFAQALPHLTRLAKDDAFLAALLGLKDEQDRCEERLARERDEFSKSKARSGTPSMSSALASWDREALQRWDLLHHEQQRKLQSWGVPCFFETDEPKHLKKQARIFDVLFGLLE